MKKVCIFSFLFFGCSEGMNISCANSTDLGNSTRLYEMCDVSAAKVGERLSMLCNVSESLIECASVANNGQTIRWLEFAFNAGSVFGWLWLGGRSVYKWLHSSPREDYMRSRFQQALSSELLGFLITVPSIISIFTDASWGNYLINAGPVLFGTCIQFPWDICKILCSCKKNRQFNSFKKFMEQLEKDIKSWKELTDQSEALIAPARDALSFLATQIMSELDQRERSLITFDEFEDENSVEQQIYECFKQVRVPASRIQESVEKSLATSVEHACRLIERSGKFIKQTDELIRKSNKLIEKSNEPVEELTLLSEQMEKFVEQSNMEETSLIQKTIRSNFFKVRKKLKAREKIKSKFTVELQEWARHELEEMKEAKLLEDEIYGRYNSTLLEFENILSNRLADNNQV